MAKSILGAGLALALLSACGEKDVILPGERFALRDAPVFENTVLPVTLPQAQVNADWSDRNGGPSHQINHPALGASLSPLFAVSIGEGDSRRARITAEPVVAGGIVYTVDARATVTATTVDGQPVWTRDLTPSRDRASDASGGAVMVGGGRVYATTGFGEITSLDAGTGAINWVQDLDAPVNASATLRGDLVYVVGRDSTAWALDINDGRIRWQYSGTPSVANFDSGASPAVSGDNLILPFPSGEVVSVYPQGGIRRWSTVVSGERLGSAASLVTDIAGDPVIMGDRVYIGNFGGRIVALDIKDGSRIWTAGEGALSPVWPVGNAVYLINDVNELVRLDANSGDPVWRIDLPNFTSERTARQRRVHAHYGPVLAGGRLIVASSDGLIRQFDPASGALIGTLEFPGGAASAPVIAGQVLYVVSKDGKLHAFR
ncbi:Outer membrane protein assembly factor BamB, contains PQQ-like beta-propeller repeat [Yoonia tamlensis]|uniref:Outer membrane protein assembly factor BamB, contains PQQ-like beta-propeller repeat n=1 Tax=Yoonia tamlensis TaxID=390270 RepID=A0A1I6GIH9_9RHOB|nr:PQQ-like beta-propeller repeat protein [Yoonia tamlensis]SFR41986.1 Outer membrane protein assembly factor BamB, contains PQQ-like beta-propeller repeat [Yoonia tamlensis]